MKWIAIKDQLPPPYKQHLFFGFSGCELGSIGEDEIIHNDRFTDRIYKATHWAEITPPEIEETK